MNMKFNKIQGKHSVGMLQSECCEFRCSEFQPFVTGPDELWSDDVTGEPAPFTLLLLHRSLKLYQLH